jgi:hypothetical protein
MKSSSHQDNSHPDRNLECDGNKNHPASQSPKPSTWSVCKTENEKEKKWKKSECHEVHEVSSTCVNQIATLGSIDKIINFMSVIKV